MAMARVLALLLIAASVVLLVIQAFAEADGPDFYDVKGVDAGDVLNIRIKADYRSAKVGEIPSGGTCLRSLGCQGGLTYTEFSTLTEAEKRKIRRQRPRWCRIEYQGTTGWVAGRYLQESTSQCQP
jgi:hypothetical protein